MKTQPMARYYMPGSFFSEDEAREISDCSIDAAVAQAPEDAFAFVLYDRPVIDFEYDPKLFRVAPVPQNESGKHYLGGKTYTPDELRALPGDHRILIGNVEGNGWGRAIQCRTGNWQPFEEGDVLVEMANV